MKICWVISISKFWATYRHGKIRIIKFKTNGVQLKCSSEDDWDRKLY